MFENEKAVRLLTYQKRCVGNIPKDLAQEIYDFNAKGKVKAVVYKPQLYNNGNINHQIKIYIKMLRMPTACVLRFTRLQNDVSFPVFDKLLVRNYLDLRTD